MLVTFEMAQATVGAEEEAGRPVGLSPGGSLPVRFFELLVIIPTLGLLVSGLMLGGMEFITRPENWLGVLFWTVVLGIVEFLPVAAWRSVQLTVGFPLAIAIAFLYSPEVAGLIVLLGSSDPRELKGEVNPVRAVFNRSQLSLTAFATSFTFHALGGSATSWSAIMPAAIPAILVNFLVNATSVSIAVGLTYQVPIRSVFGKLRIGNPMEFLVSYLGLGILGVVLARLYVEVGWWGAASFVLPLMLARQMLFRTRALEQATKELKDRELVLHALSNRITEERHEERMQIAGYLHDDLAQTLFRMGVHIEASEKLLILGEDEKAQGELEALKEAKERTVELVRDLIRDLHSSPIGRAGLAEALSQVCAEVENESGVQIHTDLREVEMPAPVQLLCYKLAREAIMNAVKHAEASEIQVGLEETDDGIRVVIRDDGKGFDPEEDAPEGHFGLAMMRERALVAGGTFHLESTPGRGTTVTAEFPSLWPSEPEEAAGEAAE